MRSQILILNKLMSTCYRISQYKILTRILYRQNTDIHTKSNKKTEVSVLNLKTIFGLY